MMAKIKNFLKKYWFFILLATIAGSLIAFYLVREETPLPDQSPPDLTPHLEQPGFIGSLVPADAQLKIEAFSFPSQLEVYRGQRQEISPEKANAIAANFGFSGEPQKSDDVLSGPTYSWSSASKYLSIVPATNKIDYGLDLYQVSPLKEGSLSTPEETRKNLEDLLERLGLTPQFEIKWQKETYLNQGFYFQPATSPQKADFIKSGFNLAVGHHQLVSHNPHQALVSIILGRNQELIRFFWQVAFKSFEKQEKFTLKTETEIRRSLTTEGVIVYVEAYEKVGQRPQITQANFDQIRLAYFQEPEKNDLIQPIFILSGQGILAKGEKTEIIAYLPALASEHLKKPQEHFQIEAPESFFNF